MNNSMEDKIKPVYEELQAYLSQIPLPENSYTKIWEKSYLDLFDPSIDELKQITGNDYDRFRIVVDDDGGIYLGVFRAKLNGLILRLHGEFYSKEPPPFGGTPTTVISQEQSQIQSQAQSVQVMVLEIQDKINEKLQDEEISQEERGFLDGVKEGLKDIRNVVGLINLILLTAQQMGIDVNQLAALLGNL